MTNDEFGAFYFPDPKLLDQSRDPGVDNYGFEIPYPFVDPGRLEAFQDEYRKRLKQRYERWDHLMVENGGASPIKSEKAKRFVRKGIPSAFRPKVWFYYSGAEESWLRHKNLYSSLAQTIADGKLPLNFSVEIDQDLHRTYPNNIYFKQNLTENPTSATFKHTPILAALRRVLLCFAMHKSTIGYIQSFSYIVGILLLFMDEEKAFFMLITIVDNIMPPHMYSKAGQGSTVEIRILLSLVKDKLPNLWTHISKMESKGMPAPGLALSHWFPLIFSDLLPIESTLRVWDSFFYEGPKVLFRVGLALFFTFQTELAACAEPLEMFQLLQNLPKKAYNCQALIEQTFSRQCTISRSDLERRRATLSRI